MGQILKTRYDANEIAKNTDFTHGETREIENLSTLLEYLLMPSTKDVIITGGIVKERAVPSMNVDVDPTLAFIKSSGKFIHTGSVLGPVPVVNGGAQNRIDLLEVRYKETTYDSQQRAYKDPTTGNISYQDFDTKARYEMEAQIIQGTEGGGVAPNHTAGWIKLAEISVDAGESTLILDADIENCTGGKDAEATTNWTAETDVTFRLESLSDIKTKIRLKHKEDGDHADDVIKGQHVDWGTGAEQVDADLLPLGTAVTSSPTGGTATNLLSTDLVRAALQETFNRLIDLSGVGNDAIKERHIDFSVNAGDVDADVLPLGTIVSKSPTGGQATNLAATSFVRAALQEILDRLADLSGVQNDAVDSRHYKADSIDEEHLNLGSGAGQVDADTIPSPDTNSRYTATKVEGQLQEIAGAGRTTESVKGLEDSKVSKSILTTIGDFFVRGSSIPERLVAGALDTYLKGQGAGVKPIYGKLALRDTRIKIGDSSHSGTGDQVITGIGFQPSVVIFLSCVSVGFIDVWSVGYDNNGEKVCLASNYLRSISVNIDRSLNSFKASGNYQRGYITAVSSDGFTISWFLSGASFTVNFTYLCLP